MKKHKLTVKVVSCESNIPEKATVTAHPIGDTPAAKFQSGRFCVDRAQSVRSEVTLQQLPDTPEVYVGELEPGRWKIDVWFAPGDWNHYCSTNFTMPDHEADLEDLVKS